MNQKYVLITGASRGIGRACALAFARNHFHVFLNCRHSLDALQQVEKEILDEHGSCTLLPGNAGNPDDVRKMFAIIESICPGLDVLVNNAGILPKFKRFDRYSDEEIERAININFYSCVYSVKTFLPMLLQSTDPGIVNIDSSAALMSLAGTSMYSASKAALKGFTEALREEFRGKCYVGLVCPGFTKTDIFRGQSNAGGKGEKVINMISTDCDLMVKMIMFGIEHKQALQIHGVDAHAMSVFGKLLPVNGSRLFSAVMKAADIDLFKEVFKDDAELAE